MTKAATIAPTPLEQLTARYDAGELTTTGYRDALKALYARADDPKEMAMIHAAFVRVGLVA